MSSISIPSRTTRAGLPAMIVFEGTSFVMTAPEPITHWSPMRTPPMMTAPIPITHVVLDNRVPASKPVFVTEPVEHPLGRMTLLARNRPIRLKPSVNDWDESFQLWTPNRSTPSIAGRNRIRHHLANRVARYAEMLRRFALAHTAVASNSNLQI